MINDANDDDDKTNDDDNTYDDDNTDDKYKTDENDGNDEDDKSDGNEDNVWWLDPFHNFSNLSLISVFYLCSTRTWFIRVVLMGGHHCALNTDRGEQQKQLYQQSLC